MENMEEMGMKSLVSDKTTMLRKGERGVWCRTEHVHLLIKEHF